MNKMRIINCDCGNSYLANIKSKTYCDKCCKIYPPLTTQTAPVADVPCNGGLEPIDRNYIKIGDKVRMKNGDVLTVRSLEFREFISREFISEERIGFVLKKDIDTILG